MRHRHSKTALICVVLFSIAGCSSEGADSDGTPSPAGSSSTTALSAATAADLRSAEAAGLKIGDLPSGWTAQPPEEDPDIPKASAELARCLGVTEAELNQSGPAEYESPDFEDENSNSVSNSISYRPTAGEISKSFQLVSDPRVPGCLTTAVKTVIEYTLDHPKSSDDTLPKGTSIGTPKIGQMSFKRFGDQSVAYRATVPVSAEGLSINVFLDLIFIAKGRAGIGMQFSGAITPFPTDQAEELAELVVGRTAADPKP